MTEKPVLERYNADSEPVTACAWCGVMMEARMGKKYCGPKCRLAACLDRAERGRELDAIRERHYQAIESLKAAIRAERLRMAKELNKFQNREGLPF